MESSFGFCFLLLLCLSRSARGQAVNGGWSSWSNYGTPCNKECGTDGVQTFSRQCNNPLPQNGGQQCQGSSEESRPCNRVPCQSSWSSWTDCDKTCGRGLRKRSALCGSDPCTGAESKQQAMECNTWIKGTCPGPCSKDGICPDRAQCVDKSNDTDPLYECVCMMGYQLAADKTCKRPPPTTSPPEVIATLNPEQKMTVVVITKTASTILLILVGLTLALFIICRIFTPDRIIQMNMEISLEIAHLFLLIPDDISTSSPNLCTGVSIALHFFFTASFFFMLLESIYTYSMVASVVQNRGMMSSAANVAAGWGCSITVVLYTMCFQYASYGSEYQCWLRVDTMMLYAQLVPIVVLTIATIIMTEAAGNANYKTLSNTDEKLILSAKISQRSNLIILILTFASWVVGILSTYRQDIGLYSTFSVLNAILGVAIFILHSLNNHKIRSMLCGLFRCCCKKRLKAREE